MIQRVRTRWLQQNLILWILCSTLSIGAAMAQMPSENPLSGEGCLIIPCSWSGCDQCDSNCYTCGEIESTCGYTCDEAVQKLESDCNEICIPFTPTPTATPTATPTNTPTATPTPIYEWVATNGGVCTAVCNQKGMSSVPYQDGNYCASGEVRPEGVSGINYIYGRWGQGNEFTSGRSIGRYCYGSNAKKNQKRDDDDTDITVACYCFKPF